MRLRFFPLFLVTVALIAILPVSVSYAFTLGGNLPQTDVTPISPVIVSTPSENGAIYHIVQYGQTLEMIAFAYGLSVDELRSLNDLGEGVSDIYIGQTLIIRKAQPPTETPTLTPTTPPPTRTPRSITPIMTPTPMPTTTATPRSMIPQGVTISRKALGYLLLGIGVVGLLYLGIHYWLSRKRPST
jgi:LysM repeat protein